MRLHRFFITESVDQKEISISNRDIIHQWKKVFRYNVGSQVVVFNGTEVDCLCVIERMTPSSATLSVLSRKDTVLPQKNIWLCISLVKKDNMELIIQKAVELGVMRVVPLLTERSEKKGLNMKRVGKIVTEATEQSGRGDLMEVLEPISLLDLFEKGVLPQEKVFFDPQYPPLTQYMRGNLQHSFALFIGPEGGFGEKDLEILKKHNVSGWSLGPHVLRAETAAIATASLFLLQ